MASIREMRLRIRSVKNLSQVTRALETVSASKVRRAMQAEAASKPYSQKAWKVLMHLERQPLQNLHPLLTERDVVKKVLVLMVASDRGLAGAYNVNIVRHTLHHFDSFEAPISYVAIGRKGRDLLIRQQVKLMAEFSNLPSPLSFLDVSPIGRLLVNEFLSGNVDQVYMAYTRFQNMLKQDLIIQQLLPVELTPEDREKAEHNAGPRATFTYEPDSSELLNQIVPRFISVQIYQAILSSQASEHAARMVAMRNASDNALDLLDVLRMDYNQARQNAITNDMLDIAGGAEALSATMKS